MSERPRVVLFDFDGTLVHITIDFEAMRNNALDVAHRYGANPDKGTFTLEMVESVRDRLAQTDAALALQFRREALAAIEAVELEAADRAEPLPGTRETLAWLGQHGIAIAIVTRNCRTAVCDVLRRHGLACDVLLTRDDVAHVKPNPEHLLEAARRLHAPPSECIMVGDHPTDVAAARGAGMTAVAVTTTRAAEGFDGQPDFILNDLRELVPIVESGAWRAALAGSRSSARS